MNIKKLAASFIAVAMIASFAGCNKDNITLFMLWDGPCDRRP